MRTTAILRERILELRRRGKSYNEIADILGIYKSRISYLVGKDPDSMAVKEKLTTKNIAKSRRRIRAIIKKSREKWSALEESAKVEARAAFQKLLNNPVFTAGIMIYWGEGDSKPKNPIRMANTDPRMVAVYVRFLKDILHVPEEKIRLGLILYPDLKDKDCKKFWAGVTKLSENSFVKSQYIQGYHPTKRLAHGVCMVTFSSRLQKVKILEWIDLFYRQFKMG